MSEVYGEPIVSTGTITLKGFQTLENSLFKSVFEILPEYRNRNYLEIYIGSNTRRKFILSSIHVMFWISEIKTEEMCILIHFLLNSHVCFLFFIATVLRDESTLMPPSDTKEKLILTGLHSIHEGQVHP